MQIGLMFLLTCVVTARLMEKKKMTVAASLYTVVFVALLTVVLLTSDNTFITTAMQNLLGSMYLPAADFAAGVMGASFFGINLLGLLTLVFVVQLALTVITVTTAVVEYLGKKSPERKFNRVHITRVSHALFLPISRKYNLLYCRMLD